jgi:hypothetical protein
MNFEAVKAWYAESVRRRMRNCGIAGVLGILLMPLALALGSALIFGMLHGVGRRRHAMVDSTTALWISLGVIPLMFLLNQAVPRKNFLDRHVEEGTRAMRAEVYAQVFLWIVLAGPRLLDWSMASLREQKRLAGVDVHGCAAVLWLLLSRYKKVPYEEIQPAIPWLDIDNTLPQVLAIPGVVALNVPPPGLSLTQDMRDMMRAGEYD